MNTHYKFVRVVIVQEFILIKLVERVPFLVRLVYTVKPIL